MSDMSLKVKHKKSVREAIMQEDESAHEKWFIQYEC